MGHSQNRQSANKRDGADAAFEIQLSKVNCVLQVQNNIIQHYFHLTFFLILVTRIHWTSSFDFLKHDLVLWIHFFKPCKLKTSFYLLYFEFHSVLVDVFSFAQFWSTE